MLDKLKKTISIHTMLSEGDSVLIGLSGGLDSVCLLYILKELAPKYNLKLFIAHLNHCFRGKESDKDQIFCEGLGKRMGIPVFTRKVRIRKTEDSARKARYEFLEGIAHRVGAKKIALGHNADDQVETVLMRLLRGAGTKGLSGIPAVRAIGDILIIRPLIDVWRKDVIYYLKKRNIPYREDVTNRQLDFFRNKIRHRLIPYLSKFNPNIKNILLNTGRNMAMVDEYIQDMVSKEFKRWPRRRWPRTGLGHRRCARTGLAHFGLAHFQKIPQIIRQELIKRFAEDYEPEISLTADQVNDILALVSDSKGSKRLSLSRGIKVIREYDRLIFSKEREKEGFEVRLFVPGKVKIPEHNILVSSELCKRIDKKARNSFEVKMDYDKIFSPLIIRNRRPGDVFQPIGLKGKKKVKDIFIDEKIPERVRDEIPIVVSGKEICWIPGYRVGERFKIGPKTKRVVKIEVRGGYG